MLETTILGTREAVLVAWSKSKYRGRMEDAPRKKCLKCFNEWLSSGHNDNEFPYFLPLDYNGLCPQCKQPIAESNQ